MTRRSHRVFDVGRAMQRFRAGTPLALRAGMLRPGRGFRIALSFAIPLGASFIAGCCGGSQGDGGCAMCAEAEQASSAECAPVEAGLDDASDAGDPGDANGD